MEDSDDEIRIEFILEAREILDLLDQNFVQLEMTPDDSKLIGNIFRGMHTLKGSSGVFAYKRLEKLAHASESLLGKVREGQLTFDTPKATILLSVADVIRDIVIGIDLTHVEPEGDDSGLIEDLMKLARGETPGSVTPIHSDPLAAVDSGVLATAQNVAFEPQLAEDKSYVAVDHPSTVSEFAVPRDVASTTLGSDSQEDSVGITANRTSELAAPVKVSLEVLDKLINLASEMVLARNRLLPFVNEYLDPSFSSAVRSIDLLTRELQERMMTTRMEPISQVWLKFPRLIRDVSAELNKKVELIQEGADTELDRTLLDAIRDPLVHIIRNSIDHGLEAPAVRLASGKPESGRVLLRASHENGMVVIEIADDGAGINFELVRLKAIEKKLVSHEGAAALTDNQLLDFIFLPGFSTKSVVSNLSGRGVGMDVVKTNVANIGGSIEIESPRGRGTNIRLKIPLTLAIMPALFVRCHGERYAIPQNSIVEMIRLDTSRKESELEDFYGVPVFRLREKLVPLLFLSQQLELDTALPVPGDVISIAVLQSSGVRFGLAVDEVLDMQEVVVKPLGSALKEIPDFAGATILGDGRVALILDIDGIATHSSLVAKIQARTINPGNDVIEQASTKEIPMLLFSLPGLDSLAIKLDLVERLEMLPVSQIQQNGNRDVVKYGLGIMPLIKLSQFVQGASEMQYSESQTLSTIVHYVKDVPVGLVVGQVQDIIYVPATFHKTEPPQRGLHGCVVLGDRIINVIDLQEILVMYSLPESSNIYPQTIDMVMH